LEADTFTNENTIFVVESNSTRDTKMWGRRLGSLLQGGELLAFSGDLGAGKTCFIKGIARGLSLREENILSPTFTMIQEHHGRLPLYHIDLYRLDNVAIDDLGLREYLFSESIAAVEWFERLEGGGNVERLSVRISYIGANSRRIEFISTGERYSSLIARFRSHFS
jgi:tRNA threonylcarbamoyladenosine biosynthesis protein TsaE